MGDTLTVIEPATEAVLSELPRANAEDVDRAVAKAKASFGAWRAVSPADRAALLRRLAETITEHREDLQTIAPVVLCPVGPESRASSEEIFGPVAVVIPFADEEEAVKLANDTIYGLSGSIDSNSVRVSTPFGGFKQSGYGRELGPHALDAYTEVKSIFLATS